MLPPDLDNLCHKLDVSYGEFKKYERPAVVSGMAALVIAFLIFALVPENEELTDHPNTTYPGIVGLLIAFGLAVSFQSKANKHRVTGFKRHAVRIYRSYNLLSKYKKDGLSSQLDKAKKYVGSVAYDLRSEWGTFRTKAPSFKSLVKPVGSFIINLESRLVPAFKSQNSLDTEKIQSTLHKLIEFFISEKFEDIGPINEELGKYDEQLKENKLRKKIQSHAQLSRVMASLGIIAGAGLLSYFAKLVAHGDDINFVTWWIVMSVPFVTAYLWKSRK